MGKTQNRKWQRREQVITQRAIAAHRTHVAANRPQMAEWALQNLTRVNAYRHKHTLMLQAAICGLIILLYAPFVAQTDKIAPFLALGIATINALATICFTIVISNAALRRRLHLNDDDEVVAVSFRATLIATALAAVVSLLVLNERRNSHGSTINHQTNPAPPTLARPIPRHCSTLKQ